jgi:hypothetical protein
VQNSLSACLNDIANLDEDTFVGDIESISASMSVLRSEFANVWGNDFILSFFSSKGPDYIRSLLQPGSCPHTGKFDVLCDKCGEERSKLDVGLWNMEVFLASEVSQILQDPKIAQVIYLQDHYAILRFY